MTLTPLDIHNKEFSRSFRGYNQEEVNEFLDRVVKDYESVIKKNIELKEEVEKLNNKIEHYQKMEETLHNAIVVAQETAEEVKENAQKEAELIKREAENDANKQIEEANNKVKQIQQEIADLTRQANAHKAKFKSILETQLNFLESEDWSDPQESSAQEQFDEQVAASEQGNSTETNLTPNQEYETEDNGEENSWENS